MKTHFDLLILIVLSCIFCSCGNQNKDLPKDKVKNIDSLTKLNVLPITKATPMIDSLLTNNEEFSSLFNDSAKVNLSIINEDYHYIIFLLANSTDPVAASPKNNSELILKLRKQREVIIVTKIIEYLVVKLIKSKCRVTIVDLKKPPSEVCGGRIGKYAEDFNRLYKVFRITKNDSMNDYESLKSGNDLVKFIADQIIERIF